MEGVRDEEVITKWLVQNVKQAQEPYELLLSEERWWEDALWTYGPRTEKLFRVPSFASATTTRSEFDRRRVKKISSCEM